MMLEVAWASSSEGSKGHPGEEGTGRGVVMEMGRGALKQGGACPRRWSGDQTRKERDRQKE